MLPSCETEARDTFKDVVVYFDMPKNDRALRNKLITFALSHNFVFTCTPYRVGFPDIIHVCIKDVFTKNIACDLGRLFDSKFPNITYVVEELYEYEPFID